MHRIRTSAALLLLAGALACTSDPLMLPGPIVAPGDLEARRAMVLDGMARRGWIVEDEKGTRILARVQIRTHVAKVWVDYGGEKITFDYGGSRNLGCVPAGDGDGCRSIHGNYNKWARNLAIDISREVTAHRVER